MDLFLIGFIYINCVTYNIYDFTPYVHIISYVGTKYMYIYYICKWEGSTEGLLVWDHKWGLCAAAFSAMNFIAFFMYFTKLAVNKQTLNLNFLWKTVEKKSGDSLSVAPWMNHSERKIDGSQRLKALHHPYKSAENKRQTSSFLLMLRCKSARRSA